MQKLRTIIFQLILFQLFISCEANNVDVKDGNSKASNNPSGSNTQSEIPYFQATKIEKYFDEMYDAFWNQYYFSDAEIRRQAFSPDGITGEKVLLRFSGADFTFIETVNFFGEGASDYLNHGKLLFKTINGQERIYLFSPYADGVTNGKVIVLNPNSETVPGTLDVIETHTAQESISNDVASFEVSNDGKWIFYIVDDFNNDNRFKVWKQSTTNPADRTILDLNFS